MLKLFPITNSNRKWDGFCGAKVGWLIDRQGDSHRHHRRLWIHSMPVFWAMAAPPSPLPPRLLSINVRKWLPLWLCPAIPHSPLHHQQPHPSIECQLVDCLPNCHSLFPFPIKALANSFESAAPEFLPLFVLLVKGYCWNDFCNCCRGLIIINRLINDRLIVHFIKGTHCHFFPFFGHHKCWFIGNTLNNSYQISSGVKIKKVFQFKK